MGNSGELLKLKQIPLRLLFLIAFALPFLPLSGCDPVVRDPSHNTQPTVTQPSNSFDTESNVTAETTPVPDYIKNAAATQNTINRTSWFDR